MGRVLAAQYEEIVIDRLYPGNLHLTKTLRPLVTDLEEALALTEAQRERTIIRMDAGGGSVDEINWLLERGYQIHGKDISSARAEIYAATVKQWFSDPQHPHRQMGWASGDRGEYVRPIKRLVLRWPPMKEEKWKKKPFHYACLLSTLEPAEVIRQLQLPVHTVTNEQAIALAYSTLYDKRGGTVEVEFKESKQGIGLNKRSKKRFAAQQMVMLLGSLAHNLIGWARRWLVRESAIFTSYGIKRFVRDLFHLSGLAEFDADGKLLCLTLNQAARLAKVLAPALKAIVAEVEIKVGTT